MKIVVRTQLYQTHCSIELIINFSAFQRDKQFVSGLRNLTDRRKRLGRTR